MSSRKRRTRSDKPAYIRHYLIREDYVAPGDILYRRLVPTTGIWAGRVCEVINIWQHGQAWVKPVELLNERMATSQEMNWFDAAHSIVEYETGIPRTQDDRPPPLPELGQRRSAVLRNTARPSRLVRAPKKETSGGV